ncbi:MAG: hypothetical protein M3552_06795 [Planctomycetota bacterium]|nr:hypothetical protein [Planctomycetota bacterium]
MFPSFSEMLRFGFSLVTGHLLARRAWRHIGLATILFVAVGWSSAAAADRGVSDHNGRLIELDRSFQHLTNEDIAALTSHTSLRRLVLAGTNVGDGALTSLADLRHLEYLDLSDTAITDRSLPAISHLRRLSTLNLSNCAITDASTTHIAYLTHLKQLYIGGTSLSDGGLARLIASHSELTDLGIGNTTASSRTAKSLSKMTRLSFIDVGGTKLSNDELLVLTSMPRLSRIIARDTPLDDEVAASLAEQLDLVAVDVGATAIGDYGVTRLCTEPLVTFYFSGTQVTDVGASAITSCQTLEFVSADDTAISDETIAGIAALPRLRLLSMNGTHARELTARAIGQNSSIISIEVARTRLLSSEFLQVASNMSLEEVNVSDTLFSRGNLLAFLRHPGLKRIFAARTKLNRDDVKLFKVRRANEYPGHPFVFIDLF